MPPLETHPTPPKEDGSFRHKRESPERSTPRTPQQPSAPWDRSTPSYAKLMKENTDGSMSAAVTPATEASTPSSTVASTPSSSASTSTPSTTTPRYYLRNIFSSGLSTSTNSVCEASSDTCETSMSSASNSPERVQMLFQDQARDDISRGASQSPPRKFSLSTPPGPLDETEEFPSTIVAKEAVGKHTRSASLRVGDSVSFPFHTIQRQRSYSRLHDSLSLEGSFKPSCGLSERRRPSRGRVSPNISSDASISSEEKFPLDTSPSPSRAGPVVAYTPYTPSHHRNTPRPSLLQQPELGGGGGDRKNPPSFWMKLLVRLAHTKGLIWLLCLVALTSLCMTVITNRSMAIAEIAVAPLAEPALVSFGSFGGERGKLMRPFATGLRGNLILSVGRSQREGPLKLHHGNEHHEKKHSGKHVDDNKHGHEAAPPQKKDQKTSHKIEDVEKHKHHGDKPSKDDRPLSLTALSHRQDHKASPSKDIKSGPTNHAHETSYSETHKTHHESKHHVSVSNKNTAHKVARLIPTVTRPRKRLDSTQRFESQDRRLYRKPSHERKAGEAGRVVFLDDSIAHIPSSRRKVPLYPADFTDNTQLYSILDSADERVKSMELRDPYEQGECVPMQDWQTTFHPSCNVVHELGLADIGDENGDDALLFGTNGYWRNAWKVDLLGGRNHLKDRDTIVLKTLKISHRFEEAHFEHDRIDAVAMERLTASPHVINAFGFCGHSVMTEYADGKRLGELADKVRKKPLERLKIARDIATGLADVHGIDGDGNATFVHFDINPANVVSIGGTLKLNDFNIGIIRRWNTTSNEPCAFPSQYPNPQWRSPEEARDEQLTEKVDIFSMGHIFFRLICGHEPWNKLEPHGKPSKTEVNEKVKRGILPTVPQEIMHTQDPELAAIRDAMLGCYVFDPTKRPSARDTANSLQSALDQLETLSTIII